MRDPVVVGAGPAGLAVASALARRGVHSLVIERGTHVGTNWRARYDRLRLHTIRSLSSLPGLPLPPRYGRWVARDDFVAYLEDYARRHAIDIRFGATVQRIRREAEAWRVETSQGSLDAPIVIVATGYSNDPLIPAWPGRSTFAGDFSHAAEYRNPAPYRERMVLVVGTGNSAAEIAVDLVDGDARHVWLSVRSAPQIVPRQVLGLPAQVVGILINETPARVGDALAAFVQGIFIGDLSPYGMPRPELGLASQFRRDQQVPIIDVGLVALLKRRRLTIVPALERFDGDTVRMRGALTLRPDAVIAATGYRRGLESLIEHVGLLDRHGLPIARGDMTHPTAPGLYFIGFENVLGGILREIGFEAERIARVVAALMHQSS